MMKKKELLEAVEGLLEMEEGLHTLCERQAVNAGFFSGIPPKNRSAVRAGLKSFCAMSEKHRLVLENLIGAIREGGRDAY